MIGYGVETTKKTYVNYNVVQSTTYKTERISVKNEADILKEFVKSRKIGAIGFHIIEKSGKIAFIEADYEIENEEQ